MNVQLAKVMLARFKLAIGFGQHECSPAFKSSYKYRVHYFSMLIRRQ